VTLVFVLYLLSQVRSGTGAGTRRGSPATQAG